MNFMCKDIGIDLGTSMTRIFLKDKGIVCTEPTVVAINSVNSEVLAVGKDAKEMLGKTPENITAIKPIRGGTIENLQGTQMLLGKLISNVCGKFGKIRAVISIPSNINDIEQKAIQETAFYAGAKEVYLVEQSLASAIGAGLNVNDITGSMILDIGGGVTEVAVLSFGGIVVSNAIKTAGDNMDNCIIEYIKEKYNILISEKASEDIKNTLGTAVNLAAKERMQVKGRNLLTGLPDVIDIYTDDVEEAMNKSVQEIIKLINITLEKTPPELSADIMKNGIVVCGGGAYIKNIDRLITNLTGLPTFIADKPEDANIKGLGKLLGDFELLKKKNRRK